MLLSSLSWKNLFQRLWKRETQRNRKKWRSVCNVQIHPLLWFYIIEFFLTPSSCESGLFTTRSCWPAALRGFVMCCSSRQTITIYSQNLLKTHKSPPHTCVNSHTYRLFDLFVLCSELLGSTDPLSLIFWQDVQIKLEWTKPKLVIYFVWKQKLHTSPFNPRNNNFHALGLSSAGCQVTITFQHTLRNRLLRNRPLMPACLIRTR